MDSKQKGTLGEQAVICDLLNRGYHVSVPVGDYLPYDLIADINGELHKVQVKASTEENNVCKVYHKKEKYQNNEYDILALYNLQSHIVVYIPYDFIKDKREFSIRYSNFTQSKSNKFTDFLSLPGE